MFREMRRKDKRLSEKEVIDILNSGEEGVLATMGQDGYPYAVPLNYAYHGESVYFHCAKFGHKIENMENHPKVSFCVIQGSKILASQFSTQYKSVVLFGRAEEALGEEKKEGLMALVRKFSKDHVPAGEAYIEKDWKKTRVFKICIDHISGKAGH